MLQNDLKETICVQTKFSSVVKLKQFSTKDLGSKNPPRQHKRITASYHKHLTASLATKRDKNVKAEGIGRTTTQRCAVMEMKDKGIWIEFYFFFLFFFPAVYRHCVSLTDRTQNKTFTHYPFIQVEIKKTIYLLTRQVPVCLLSGDGAGWFRCWGHTHKYKHTLWSSDPPACLSNRQR